MNFPYKSLNLKIKIRQPLVKHGNVPILYHPTFTITFFFWTYTNLFLFDFRRSCYFVRRRNLFVSVVRALPFIRHPTKLVKSVVVNGTVSKSLNRYSLLLSMEKPRKSLDRWCLGIVTTNSRGTGRITTY